MAVRYTRGHGPVPVHILYRVKQTVPLVPVIWFFGHPLVANDISSKSAPMIVLFLRVLRFLHLGHYTIILRVRTYILCILPSLFFNHVIGHTAYVYILMLINITSFHSVLRYHFMRPKLNTFINKLNVYLNVFFFLTE